MNNLWMHRGFEIFIQHLHALRRLDACAGVCTLHLRSRRRPGVCLKAQVRLGGGVLHSYSPAWRMMWQRPRQLALAPGMQPNHRSQS